MWGAQVAPVMEGDLQRLESGGWNRISCLGFESKMKIATDHNRTLNVRHSKPTANHLTVLSAEPVARMLGLSGLNAMQLTSAMWASECEGMREELCGANYTREGEKHPHLSPPIHTLPPFTPHTCSCHDGPCGRPPQVPEDQLLVITDRAKDILMMAVPRDILCIEEGGGLWGGGEGRDILVMVAVPRDILCISQSHHRPVTLQASHTSTTP